MSTRQFITRRSLVLTAPRRLEWIAEKLPTPGENEVLVRTRAGAISMGTELPHYRGISRTSKPRPYPYMTGYESLGIVIERGAAVSELQMGQRVVSFYGHRSHAIIPEEKALPVPDQITDRVALLAILSCDAAKGIHKVRPKAEEAVLVSGAGTMGLLTVFLLKELGIQYIDVIEPAEKRREMARQFGARRTASSMEALPKDSYQVGIECSSRNAAFEALQAMMAQGGQICILADGNIEPLTLIPAFHEKELHIVGSSDGLDYRKHARWFFQRDPGRLQLLEQLFEHDVTAENLSNIFEDLVRQTLTAIKVFVRYDPNQEKDILLQRESI
ncbi:MAG: zinc-binding dehydrogenase [Ktedonobacteraceae bacterium]|nr:zinc-binding dehydrogenase [Ktedonobacteraceae bacterium]